MGGKAEPFSWRSVEHELAVEYLENLRYFGWCYHLFLLSLWLNTVFAHLENRLWAIIFPQERAPRQALTYFKLTIQTMKKGKLFEVNNKTPEGLSTLLIVNFGHNSLFFLLSCRWIWTCKCLLCPTLSIYKRWHNILRQLFTDVQKSQRNNKQRFIRKDCDPN